MKKALVILLAVGLLVGLLIAAGCGEKKTVKTPEGEVTVTEDEGEVTIHGEEGDVTYKSSDEEPTSAELGVPIYTGAEYVPGSGASASATGQDGDVATAYATYTTSDSYQKVVAWYKDELGTPFYEGTGGEQQTIWMKTVGQESTTTVTVTVEGGKVTIQISKIEGLMGQ